MYMRKRISDKNIFPCFSLEAEYQKLHQLFLDHVAFGRILGISSRSRPCLSYNNCLQAMFLDWKLRGSFTCIEEMLSSLEIGEVDFDMNTTEERLLDYIQFILNAVIFVDEMENTKQYMVYKANDAICNAIRKTDTGNCKRYL